MSIPPAYHQVTGPGQRTGWLRLEGATPFADEGVAEVRIAAQPLGGRTLGAHRQVADVAAALRAFRKDGEADLGGVRGAMLVVPNPVAAGGGNVIAGTEQNQAELLGRGDGEFRRATGVVNHIFHGRTGIRLACTCQDRTSKRLMEIGASFRLDVIKAL